jgi:hypothetical protein
MCFHCLFTADAFTFGTFHMYTKIHMYHILHMKCTVLLVFSCFLIVFSLQKYVFLVHFKCIQKYSCIIYYTWMHSFASVFMCFHCLFTAETCAFGTFHVYTKIHMCHILYMKCTVLLVFLCVFTVFSLQKHVLLVHFTCIQKYKCTLYYTCNAQFC